MIFDNLEQRMANAYIKVFPRFVPDENAPVTVNEQEQFYLMMNNLYQLAYDEPLLFVADLHEDDVYPSRYKKSYGKPELIKNMRKFTKEVDKLVHNMFMFGKCSRAVPSAQPIKFTNRQQIILSRLSINDLNSLPPAWTWMSNRPDISITAFSKCLFNKNHVYSTDIYAGLLGEIPFRKLENWMVANGYKAYDIYGLIGSDCKFSLTYANPKWNKEKPRGGCDYKIKHTGISAQYDDYTKNPLKIGLCIPNGLKTYLEAFATMSENLQNFIIEHTKKCDGCRYCVQTDKTKTRPLALIKVSHKKAEHNLCPYFPGGWFCWTKLTDELVDQIIEALSFMDRFAPNE
jgi:hypothetical protein